VDTWPVDSDMPLYDTSPAVLRILLRKYRRNYIVGFPRGRGHWERTWPPPEDLARAVAAGVIADR
jgi:hypothetical protein